MSSALPYTYASLYLSLISIKHYRFSINKKCIAVYAITTKAAPNTASPIVSFQKARLSNPKALRIDAPGTSISRPYR